MRDCEDRSADDERGKQLSLRSSIRSKCVYGHSDEGIRSRNLMHAAAGFKYKIVYRRTIVQPATSKSRLYEQELGA